jgi:hypothetical protein
MAHEGGWQLVRDADGTVRSIPQVPDFEPTARAPDHATV